MKKKKKLIYFIIAFYLISFIVVMVLASQILNYNRIHPSKTQGDTTLTRLYVRNSGMKINEMNAFITPMDAQFLRLNVTPVSDNKTVTLEVEEQDESGVSIDYVLMDEKNEKEIESGTCNELQRIEGVRQTDIVFKSELASGKEYCLNLTLQDAKGGTFYYYTRVKYGNDLRAYDKLQYAIDFHDATFNKAATTKIAEYLGASADSVSNDYRKVSICSDSETVTWGSLNPSIVGDVEISFTDIDSQNGDIQMIYEIQSMDRSGSEYKYTVCENYSVSSTGSTETLVDYSRSMEEKLDNESFVFNNNLMRLGIVNETQLDVQVYGKQEPVEEETESETDEAAMNKKEEEYNTYISFVADGALWVYNTRDNLLTQAFGFGKETEGDNSARNASYLQHGIKVLRTEENGDVYFAVYGYMYNGDNEGAFGIEVNYYDRAGGTFTEMLFIPYDKGFNILKRGIEQMAFIDDDHVFYLCLEDSVYKIDLIMRSSEVIVENIDNEDCVVENDGCSIVKCEKNDQGNVNAIIWENLYNGKKKEIRQDGKQLKLAGMLGANLVYAIGDDINNSRRLSTVYIVDFDLNVLKEYTMKNGYITDVGVKHGLVVISRADNNQNALSDDYIIYNEVSDQNISIRDINDKTRMMESWMTTDAYGNDAPVVLFARAIEAYRSTDIDFKAIEGVYSGYYVRNNGNTTKFDSFREAYVEASAVSGEILDAYERVICCPAVKEDKTGLGGGSLAAVGEDRTAQEKEVLSWLARFEKTGGGDVQATGDMLSDMQTNLPDVTVVDLTGLPLEKTLAMISDGYPLVVVNSEGSWCVVTGYGDGYITVSDSKDGTTVNYERDSVLSGIASSGNIIYSYYR